MGTAGTEYFDAFESRRSTYIGPVGNGSLITTTINYVYDPLYRLTNANYSGAYTYTFAYAYDQVGNRTTQTRTITSTQVITYVYDNANRMTKVGGITYTWDNNGNLTNDGSALYRYDQANRLISTTLSGTTSLFNYNGDGVRLKQIIAGVPTTYTQDLAAPLPVVLQARTGTTTTKYIYSLGTRPLAQNSTAWEYLLPDALGSVRQIVDANGSVTLAKSYEPYGSVLNSTGTASSIYGFSGEQADNTGLIYLRARYMQPRLGIFLAADSEPANMIRPSAGGIYLYAEGDPINHADPSGRCVFCDSGDAIKVDGRVNGIPDVLTVRARPADNAPEIARVRDNQRVRIGSQLIGLGEEAWRQVFVPDFGDGQPAMQTGWVPNVRLLDNCDGPEGTFACLPVAGGIVWTQGFGPNQFAQDRCGGPLGLNAANCPYGDLRGLHNGLDFGVNRGTSLVWMGTSNGIVRNRHGGDAAPNIVIELEGQDVDVLFGHISRSYDGVSRAEQTIRPGQTIGESGGNHLHLGVRSGRVFYNPLDYFAAGLHSQIISPMGGYPEPYGPYFMISFDADAADGANFWIDCPDLTGITFLTGIAGQD